MKAVHLVFVQSLKPEDSGKALIADLVTLTEADLDQCMFLRLQSWDELGRHKLLNSLLGKHLKITIETLE